MNTEIQFRVYAEHYIRARLLEAENYQMLNQLRKQCPKGISLGWQVFVDRLGGSLTALGEKLKGLESSLASWREYKGRPG